MSETKRTPLKTVHWEEESNANRTNSSVEDTMNVNIEVSISPTKSSPRKKRKATTTTKMLENELIADVNRRNSMNLASMVGETANLNLMVASLRRQNEDLKAKLADSKSGGNKRSSENLNSIDKLLMEQKESECDDLKKTVANLEKLLNLEREERDAHEKKTLGLLEDVKKKWHDRDDKRQQQLKKDLEDANTVVQDMELELHKKSSDLDAAKEDIETLQTVKQSLKAKLKECKTKLEATVVNYESKVEQIERLESKIASLESDLNKKEMEDKKKKRVSILINDNKAELEALQEQVDQLLRQKRTLESDLADLKLTSKLTANRLDSLQKEYDSHLARCDGELVKINSRNSKLSEKNESLERQLEVMKGKLKDKEKALSQLEQVQESLEAKIPTKETLDAYANTRVSDLHAEIEKLKDDNRILKVDVRLGERKQKEAEGRLDLYKEMYNDLRKKNQKETTDDKDKQDKIDTLEKDLAAEKRHLEGEKEKNKSLQTRIDSLRKEIKEFREENEALKDADSQLKKTQEKLNKVLENSQESTDFKKKYELTKNICLELEDQVKEFERVIEKLEQNQDKLKASNQELKIKADEAASELIKTKREINELKSTSAFKETKLKDLEEKNKEIEKYYETEGATWKVKFEESSKLKKEQTVAIVELKDELNKLERESSRLTSENDGLFEQNTKLKEEMTTLITSFHSLKDSHLMLQNTVQELGDKLTNKDEDLERKNGKIALLKKELEAKKIEHQETLNQLKKLSQHLPDRTPKKNEKPRATFLL